MENIIISNQDKFNELKNNLVKGGLDNLLFISDFDRTLTKAFNQEGEFVSSMVSILRDEKILSEEYEKKSRELFEYYYPIESDLGVDLQEKSVQMDVWWEKHFDLLVGSQMKKNDLEKVIKSDRVILRDYTSDIISICEERSIPFVIFSANVLGTDSMRELFDHCLLYTSPSPRD